MRGVDEDDLRLMGFEAVLPHPSRVIIMKALYIHGQMEFRDIKNMLNLSDGAISHYLKDLEDKGLICALRSFQGKQRRVSYELTEDGRKKFKEFASVLRKVVSNESLS